MNKSKDTATKISHIWSEEYDRWIYIEYNEQRKIIGLNFMQGDDYIFFKEHFAVTDNKLTSFFSEMKHQFPVELASVPRLEFINKVSHVFLGSNWKYKLNTNTNR